MRKNPRGIDLDASTKIDKMDMIDTEILNPRQIDSATKIDKMDEIDKWQKT